MLVLTKNVLNFPKKCPGSCLLEALGERQEEIKITQSQLTSPDKGHVFHNKIYVFDQMSLELLLKSLFLNLAFIYKMRCCEIPGVVLTEYYVPQT